MLRFNRFIELKAPETLIESGPTKELTKDDIEDALMEGLDDEPEVKADDDILSEEKEEPEKKEEKEEELELEPEVDLSLGDDVPRKEILKVYPDLFKKFPQLEKAYYRERAYAEIIPTIEDAKELVTKGENYDKFEQELFGGNLNVVMNSVKTTDPKAFNKMVDNYLPELHKVDQGAYYHVLNSVLKTAIAGMVKEGKRINNDDLQAAAVIVNQYLYGSTEFVPPQESYGPKHVETDESTKLQSEREQFVKEKFDSALEELSSQATNVVKSTISARIDPKGVMTDYVKRTAIKDALEEVEQTLESDKRYKANITLLWKEAVKKNFNSESKLAIKTAYINKVKTLLPSIIDKHKAAALKGLGKRESTERSEPERKGPIQIGRSTTANNSSKQNTVPKGMSTFDFLNSDD